MGCVPVCCSCSLATVGGKWLCSGGLFSVPLTPTPELCEKSPVCLDDWVPGARAWEETFLASGWGGGALSYLPPCLGPKAVPLLPGGLEWEAGC